MWGWTPIDDCRSVGVSDPRFRADKIASREKALADARGTFAGSCASSKNRRCRRLHHFATPCNRATARNDLLHSSGSLLQCIGMLLELSLSDADEVLGEQAEPCEEPDGVVGGHDKTNDRGVVTEPFAAGEPRHAITKLGGGLRLPLGKQECGVWFALVT